LAIYAFATHTPEHVSIVDIGVGPSASNDYTSRFFEHWQHLYRTPTRMFRTYDEYFHGLIESWSTRLRTDQDDIADWGKETKEYQDHHQYGRYFPLPYSSIPKPARTELSEQQSDVNRVFPYADLVYDYYRDRNFYRYARPWFLNQTQAQASQYT
jgi:hypothetical protein